MRFDIATDAGGRLEVLLHDPELDPLYPGMWTCRFGWRGDAEYVGRAFGATSLGALMNAIPLLEARLRLAFPDEVLTHEGLPLFFHDTPGAA